MHTVGVGAGAPINHKRLAPPAYAITRMTQPQMEILTPNHAVITINIQIDIFVNIHYR